MYTLIIFLILCSVEYGFYRWKKSEVMEYQNLMNSAVKYTQIDRRVIFLSNMVNLFTKFLWVMVGFLLFINLIISTIVGSIIYVIVSLF